MSWLLRYMAAAPIGHCVTCALQDAEAASKDELIEQLHCTLNAAIIACYSPLVGRGLLL
jgi:hypothetical protein